MKIIIPAKKNSSRVPDKNWRPFHNGKSLVEIKIDQVVRHFGTESVFLSCEDPEKKKLADLMGIGFLLRSERWALDSTPWPDVIQGIVQETNFDENEDIFWIEVVNPLFDRYHLMYQKWLEFRETHDSMVLAAPFNKFLITHSGKPVNFQYGKWHAMSQNIEPLYEWDSACIIRKRDLLYYSYPIGRTPAIFSTEDQCVDIDTMKDFELAQYFFNKHHNNEH
jgi:CMP-N-acetylneuraminic acid synthetase